MKLEKYVPEELGRLPARFKRAWDPPGEVAAMVYLRWQPPGRPV